MYKDEGMYRMGVWWDDRDGVVGDGPCAVPSVIAA